MPEITKALVLYMILVVLILAAFHFAGLVKLTF